MNYKEIKNQLKVLLKKVVKQHFNLDLEKVVLNKPPQSEMGDLSFACFQAAKRVNKNPAEIASKLSELLLPKINYAKIKSIGPYLNFFIDDKLLFKSVVGNIIDQGEQIAESQVGKNQQVLVEYSSPNTNKPQHIGHLRNNFLGDSLARILESQGFNVKKVSVVNDRGVHICKSMLMYQKYGQEQNPKNFDIKPDHFVGKFYSRFVQQDNQDQLKKEVQQMLRKWEAGDKRVLQLWKKLNNWVYQGWEKTYKILGITFDKIYYESQIYQKGKDIVAQGLKKKIFYKTKDGAVEVDLRKYGLDKKVLLRSDGTSVYITMDLALAKLKFKDFPNAIKSIYVVGSAQEYHFKVLFKILELLGYQKVSNYYHLSYGMVRLESGKMSSRAGNVFYADDLIAEIIKLAQTEVKKRQNKTSGLEKRASKIGIGALKYYLLAVDPKKDIVFDSRKAVDFQGDTGAYIMYTYARMASIKLKIKDQRSKWKIKNQKLTTTKLNKKEREIISHLSQFQSILERAGRNYNPALLAHFLCELSALINSFYHKHHVLKAEPEIRNQRLLILQACCMVLKKGMQLLGIEVVDKM